MIRRRLLTLLALTSVALLAGCGGGNGEAEAKGPRGFWGLTGEPRTDADFAKIASADVEVVRILINWNSVDPSAAANDFNWRATDERIAAMARNGIRPLPFLFGTPEWAGDEKTPPTESAATLDAFKEFARAVAARYGREGTFWDRFALTDPGVRPKKPQIWECWNEMNIPAFWNPPSPRAYGRFLKACAASVRAGDSSARIMTGGVFGAPGAQGSILSWHFIARLMKVRDIKKSIDVVGMHPYASGLKGVKQQTAKVRRALNSNGGRKIPMIIDEIGWGSDPNADSLVAKTPQGQARALRASFNLFLKMRKRWKIESVFWYRDRDPAVPGESPCPFCDSAGLLNADGTPKPAWNAFLSFTKR